MGRFRIMQNNFTGGEQTPLLCAAVDLDKYRTSVEQQENFLNLAQGPATFRPGTRFIAATKDSTKNSRLLPFKFSETQALQMEFGDYYVRFYQNQAQVTDGNPVPGFPQGTPYEVNTPYSADEIDQLYSFQSGDIIYLLHPLHAPMMLMRYGAMDWQMQPVPYADYRFVHWDLGRLQPNASVEVSIRAKVSQSSEGDATTGK